LTVLLAVLLTVPLAVPLAGLLTVLLGVKILYILREEVDVLVSWEEEGKEEEIVRREMCGEKFEDFLLGVGYCRILYTDKYRSSLMRNMIKIECRLIAIFS